MGQQALKIIFAGTPDFSVRPLKALIDSPHEVIAVYTQPDRPSGRGRKLTPSPVKACALAHGIRVFQPDKLNAPEDQQALAELQGDLMVVVAYGIILPEAVLSAPRLGCINIHASLLPRWRGAAPIQRAILAADAQTGITIMQMDIGLDTGDMLLKMPCAIAPDDSASSLHDRLAILGAKALMQVLPGLRDGRLVGEKQDDAQSSYAKKLQKSEALIDWAKPAAEIVAQVNAFNAWPVAQTPVDIKNNGQAQMMRIWRAQAIEYSGEDMPQDALPGQVLRCARAGIDVLTGDGCLRLLNIQMPGKKPMDVGVFVNANDISGMQLGQL